VISPDLESRLARVEAAQARSTATHEIQNLMGRYEFWHVANLHQRCLGLFALETPGVRIEVPGGLYEGRAGVERFFLAYHGDHDADRPGSRLDGDMHMHTLTTPVIEIADDLRTAKGAWISPGHETMAGRNPHTGEPLPAKPRAYWAWIKYGADFAREHGHWKIWHLGVYATFLAPYDTSWVDAEHVPTKAALPPDKAPDRFLEDPAPWMYAADKPHLNVPPPPEPYATFDEATAYASP
jgi:hypothetical protein